MYQNLNNFYTPTEKIIKTFKMKSEANLNWHIWESNRRFCLDITKNHQLKKIIIS